ncbi:MAG: hypothetical protein R3F33_17780 [Planctomycetota bacterium]
MNPKDDAQEARSKAELDSQYESRVTASFKIVGRVTSTTGSSLREGARIEVERVSGLVAVVATANVDKKAAYAVVVPAEIGCTYSVNLVVDSGWAKPSFVYNPAVGSVLEVNLDYLEGQGAWFQVVGLDGEGVPGARVLGTTESSFGRSALIGESGEGGFVRIIGVPESKASVWAQSGKEMSSVVAVKFPSEEITTQLVLQPAGNLRVAIESEQRTASLVTISSEEGLQIKEMLPAETGAVPQWHEFTLPVGNYLVLANGSDGTVSKVHAVEIESGSHHEVQLKLMNGVLLHGAVFNGLGLPVSGAVVGLARRLATLPLARTGPDGEFAFPIGPLGADEQVVVTVSHDEFSSRAFSVDRARISEPQEIVLSARTKIAVRIPRVDELQKWTVDLEATLGRDSRWIAEPQESFEIEDVSLGPYHLFLHYGEYQYWSIGGIAVEGHREECVMQMIGDCELHVSCVEGQQPPAGAYVEVSCDSFPRMRCISDLDSAGRGILSGLASGEYNVALMDESGVCLDLLKLVLAPKDVISATFQERGGGAYAKVLGPRGEAVKYASVYQMPDGAGVHQTSRTDEFGMVRVFGDNSRDVRFYLKHPEFGVLWGALLKAADLSGSSKDEPRVIEMHEQYELALDVVDRVGPVRGIEARLLGVGLVMEVCPRVQSDEFGRAVFRGISRGLFKVLIDDPRYWPFRAEVDVEPQMELTQVVLDRRVSGLVEVQAANQLPLTKFEMRLVSKKYGQNVEYWKGLGLIDIDVRPLGAARSAVSLRGIPEGEYTVTVTAPDGEVREFGVEFRAGEENSRVVVWE